METSSDEPVVPRFAWLCGKTITLIVVFVLQTILTIWLNAEAPHWFFEPAMYQVGPVWSEEAVIGGGASGTLPLVSEHATVLAYNGGHVPVSNVQIAISVPATANVSVAPWPADSTEVVKNPAAHGMWNQPTPPPDYLLQCSNNKGILALDTCCGAVICLTRPAGSARGKFVVRVIDSADAITHKVDSWGEAVALFHGNLRAAQHGFFLATFFFLVVSGTALVFYLQTDFGYRKTTRRVYSAEAKAEALSEENTQLRSRQRTYDALISEIDRDALRRYDGTEYDGKPLPDPQAAIRLLNELAKGAIPYREKKKGNSRGS